MSDQSHDLCYMMSPPETVIQARLALPVLPWHCSRQLSSLPFFLKFCLETPKTRECFCNQKTHLQSSHLILAFNSSVKLWTPNYWTKSYKIVSFFFFFKLFIWPAQEWELSSELTWTNLFGYNFAVKCSQCEWTSVIFFFKSFIN